MTKLRILIPLLAFIMTILSGFGVHAVRRATISDMFITAERDDLPLVLTYGDKRLVTPWRLHSLDGRTVGLYSISSQALPCIGFMPDENVFYYWNTSLYTTSLYSLNLPDDRLNLLLSLESSPLFNLINSEELWPVNAPWMLSIEDKVLRMTNHATGEKISRFMENDPPWNTQLSQSGYFTQFAFSSLARTLYVHGINYTTAMSQGSFVSRLFRYDIESDDWTEIHQGDYTNQMSAAPDGKIVAIDNYQAINASREVVFIDGITGNTIKTVQDAAWPFVGYRWAACVDISMMTPGTGRNPPSGSYYIKIFDMENNWEEHKIPVSDNPRYPNPFVIPFNLAIIEPGE